MGVQSGKFYDVAYTNKMFSDFSDAIEIFADTASNHVESITRMVASEAWGGIEACTGKSLLNRDESVLVGEIISIQKDIAEVQSTIAKKFALEVDRAIDARIDYDNIERIYKNFQSYYADFQDIAELAAKDAQSLANMYSKYGPVSIPDFTSSVLNFIELCGDDEVANGYLYECMNKLAKFDKETLELIKEKSFLYRIMNIKDTLKLPMDICNLADAITLDVRDFHIWNMPGFHANSFIPEMVAEAVVSTIKDIFIDLKYDFSRYIKNIIFGNNNFIEDLEGITMKDIASWFEQNSDLYGLIKVWSKENQTMRDILAAFDFKTNEDGSYTVDVHAYSLLGHDFCWQQIGGYTDLYDEIFDTATDMERYKYVVHVPTEKGDTDTFTFWFWKGDYLNLGYGGEVGIYTGDGKKNPIVWVDPKYELNMTMRIDYDGDGIYDQDATTYDKKPTWWITNFNPNAADEYFDDNEKFSADNMTIEYKIDLTRNKDIYEAWKTQIETLDTDEPGEYVFEDGYVIYTFTGEGLEID